MDIDPKEWAESSIQLICSCAVLQQASPERETCRQAMQLAGTVYQRAGDSMLTTGIDILPVHLRDQLDAAIADLKTVYNSFTL